MSHSAHVLMRRSRRHTAAWWIVTLLSAAIVVYGALYLALQERMFPAELAESFRSRPWGIYPHVVVGMLGLTLGPLQFHPRVQANTLRHRRIGTAYVVIALLVGIVGVYMASHSFGGVITHAGFGLLGAGVFATTAIAYRMVRHHHYRTHREWMIRSYALMFAAPSLRILLPLLIIAYRGRFPPAYLWVSWLCWVPNVLFAEWYIRHTRKRVLEFGGAPLRHR